MTETDDDRSVVDLALDAFVYAPLGLVLEARDLMPKMAERGRGQIALARLAGKVAAQRGKAAVGNRERPGSTGEPNGSTPSGPSDDEPTVVLPIEDYDELSAPQLLPHLDGLAADDLDALLAYEQDHRARATVINRIKQLQA